MTEQTQLSTQLSIEEVEDMVDHIHELMNRCIKLIPRAGKYECIIQAVVADLLKAYCDMLLAYMYIRK
jgi:hypothetical protein